MEVMRGVLSGIGFLAIVVGGIGVVYGGVLLNSRDPLGLPAVGVGMLAVVLGLLLLRAVAVVR